MSCLREIACGFTDWVHGIGITSDYVFATAT